MKLPISCKNHWAECDFSGNLESVVTHEVDCPYRMVTCVVLNCYDDIRFNLGRDSQEKKLIEKLIEKFLEIYYSGKMKKLE